MVDKEESFRNFVSAMKIEKAAKEEGFKVTFHRNLGNEQFFYLKKIEDKNEMVKK